MFEVRQPIAPNLPHEGLTISRHKSAQGAYRRIAEDLRALRRMPGHAGAYLDRYVWDCERQEVVPPDAPRRAPQMGPTRAISVRVPVPVADALADQARRSGITLAARVTEILLAAAPSSVLAELGR